MLPHSQSRVLYGILFPQVSDVDRFELTLDRTKGSAGVRALTCSSCKARKYGEAAISSIARAVTST